MLKQQEEYPELEDFKRVFINPIIVEESGKEWKFEEGCLSIPGIREDVSRQPDVTIEYYNEKFELIEKDNPARFLYEKVGFIKNRTLNDMVFRKD